MTTATALVGDVPTGARRARSMTLDDLAVPDGDALETSDRRGAVPASRRFPWTGKTCRDKPMWTTGARRAAQLLWFAAALG